MPWPARIRHKSDRLTDNETIENRFYPLYGHILQECFSGERFSVCPQYSTPAAQTGGVDAVDFVVTYVIEALDLDSVVFFVEIKPPTDLPVLLARQGADKQMRQRFGEMAHLVRVPTLYGISAIGRHLRYYKYNVSTGDVEPVEIPDSLTRVVDTVPMEKWDSNIMEEEGRDRFLAMVQKIYSMVDALW